MADGDRIRDIPSLKELEGLTRTFQIFEQAFPVLKPMLKMFGVDISSAENAYEDLNRENIADDVDRLASLPDRFNGHFIERGWVMYGDMNYEVALKAVSLADEGDIEAAEAVLTEHYDADTISFLVNRMKQIEAFQPRWSLATKALKDYEVGRYHACIPVVILLADGLVQQVYINTHGEGKNLSAEKVNLKAWDSIAAHSQGLEALHKVLMQNRKTTRTDPINIPYRHGIMHGMDLGYDNETVADKAWSTLFAVGEWARKAEADELDAPGDEDGRNPWQDLLDALETRRQTKQIEKAAGEWEPRGLRIGEDIPANGGPEDYPKGTPERTLVEILHYWAEENYGYLAQRLLDRDGEAKQPGDVRQQFEFIDLLDYRLISMEDVSPVFTDIVVELKRELMGEHQQGKVEMRMTCVDENGDPAIVEEGAWTTYTEISLLSPME